MELLQQCSINTKRSRLQIKAERFNPRNDPHPVQNRAYSDLHVAVYNGDYKEMERLLDDGFDVCTRDYSRNIPLHLAAGLDDPVATEILLKRGIGKQQEHCCNRHNAEPLMVAVLAESVLLVKMFLKYGCKNNISLCLNYAVRLNNFEIVKILLLEGADASKINSKGYSLLHWACAYGDFEIVQILLEHGAGKCSNKRTFEDQISPLEVTVVWGREDVFDLLLRYGANIHQRNSKGESLLHFAVITSQVKMLRLLINRGLDLHVKTRRNKSLLHYAMIENYPLLSSFSSKVDHICENIRIIETLIRHGFKVDEKDRYGRTMLHYAVAYDCKEKVLCLLVHGADVYEKDMSLKHYDNSPNTFRCLLNLSVSSGGNCVGPLLSFGLDYSKLYEISGYHDRPEVEKIFAKYFKKKIVAQLFVNPEDKELAMKHDLKDFEKSCVEEMQEMKKVQLYEDTTIFNLLQTKTKRGLVAHAQNPQVRDFFECDFDYGKFPIYEDILIRNYVEGRRYVPVYDAATESLRAVICVNQFPLPDLVIEKISDYLDVPDMRNLIIVNRSLK